MSELKGIDELFEARHFDREVIVSCVRRYLRHKFRLRDLVAIMAERGLPIAHTTIMRWVRHYAPEFEKRWQRFVREVGRGAPDRAARLGLLPRNAVDAGSATGGGVLWTTSRAAGTVVAEGVVDWEDEPIWATGSIDCTSRIAA